MSFSTYSKGRICLLYTSSAFQPAAGISIAYNDMKILEVHALFDAITNGADYVTDFEFGYKIDRTVAAVIESSKTHEWVDVK